MTDPAEREIATEQIGGWGLDLGSVVLLACAAVAIVLFVVLP